MQNDRTRIDRILHRLEKPVPLARRNQMRDGAAAIRPFDQTEKLANRFANAMVESCS
jgi:hypothetical protein